MPTDRSVGMKYIRKFFDSKAGTDIPVIVYPFLDFLCYLGMVGRSLTQDFFFGNYLALHDTFHLFVKQQVVLVAAEKVDVEWDGREYPNEHPLIGQEGKQSTAYPEYNSPPGKDGHPFDVRPDVVRMRVIENADCLVISQQQPADKEKPVANQPYRHDSQSDFLHSPARQQKQYHAGEDGEQQPHTEVSLQPPPRDIETVEQRSECRTEQPVAQEIGGQVHQYGSIDIHEPNSEEKMYRIVCGEQQQCDAHNPPGTQVILENNFLRCLGKEKIKAEEQHQRQSDTK